jgi:predicted  nucleic acid-binding Zn-ribbon protein
VQASEQLVEKTKGLEATQQESIDQLQVVQDQLQTMKRLMATQQADTKRLSEQVTTLNESVENLRQSFASARAAETETPSVTRRKPARRHVQTSARRRSRG